MENCRKQSARFLFWNLVYFRRIFSLVATMKYRKLFLGNLREGIYGTCYLRGHFPFSSNTPPYKPHADEINPVYSAAEIHL